MGTIGIIALLGVASFLFMPSFINLYRDLILPTISPSYEAGIESFSVTVIPYLWILAVVITIGVLVYNRFKGGSQNE